MSLLKGTVRSYDSVTGTAEVELVGSHGQYVTVPVATDLDSKTVVAGKKCAVLSFDDRDSGDAVLVATYDDSFLMGSAPLDDHDHTGDTGDGGQLEADLSLLATGDAATKVLTPDGANAVQWSDVPVHASRHQNAGADEISVADLSGLLADGQTPLAHKASHQNAGADEISVADLSGLLADGQTPLDHDHTGDAGDGGMLEADHTLKVTGGTTGHVLTIQADDTIAAEAAAGGGGDAVLDEASATATAATNTNSTSMVTLNSMSVSITVSEACKVLLLFHGSMYNSVAGKSVYVRFYNGATGLGSEFEMQMMASAYNMTAAPLHYFGTLTSGTHTFTLKWRTVSGGHAYTSSNASERRISAIAFTG